MKRIPALIPLSHDHQHGLAATLRLRRAADATDAASAVDDVPGRDEANALLVGEVAGFLQFAQRELFPHFAEEEHLLLPRCAPHLAELGPDIARLAIEHAQIRHELEQLANVHAAERRDAAALATMARAVATLLHDHIRWEEREFFPRIQDTLTVDEIADLALQPRAHPE